MIEIRPAQERDIPPICSFDHLADRNDRKAFIADSVRSGSASVAVLSGEVVAYMVIQYTFFSRGFIAMLYVAPEHRRKGIGSALVRHAESICTTDKLFTSTNESNVIMQALLEKLGYAQTGVINNLDEGDPELVYFKRFKQADNERRQETNP